MIRVTVALLQLCRCAQRPAPAGPSAPANAVTIDINISTGTNLSSGRRITCKEGERLLRNRGDLGTCAGSIVVVGILSTARGAATTGSKSRFVPAMDGWWTCDA